MSLLDLGRKQDVEVDESAAVDSSKQPTEVDQRYSFVL